jgi:hypothetical protein
MTDIDDEGPPCLSCGVPLPPMDGVQVQAALMTMPEGCYCGDYSARLAAAPSYGDWLDAEWERRQGGRPGG